MSRTTSIHTDTYIRYTTLPSIPSTHQASFLHVHHAHILTHYTHHIIVTTYYIYVYINMHTICIKLIPLTQNYVHYIIFHRTLHACISHMQYMSYLKSTIHMYVY